MNTLSDLIMSLIWHSTSSSSFSFFLVTQNNAMKTVMTDGESAAVWDSQAARRCSEIQNLHYMKYGENRIL